MDKNPDWSCGPEQIREFSRHNPNIIISSSPFEKTKLADSLLRAADCPAVFLDFDLLYSGYMTSGLIQKRDDIMLVRANMQDWNKTLQTVLEQMSRDRLMVVLDSFNGFHNMYGDIKSARLVNASLMLLSYVAGFKGCPVVALALTRQNSLGRWVMSPGGRQIVGSKNSCLYSIRNDNGVLSLRRIRDQAGKTAL